MVFLISSRLFIQKMVVPHCARGPKLCNKCKAAAVNPRICLVQVFLQPGGITRPVDQFPVDGKDMYYEYDVVRTFADETEAKHYAKLHSEVQVLRL